MFHIKLPQTKGNVQYNCGLTSYYFVGTYFLILGTTRK